MICLSVQWEINNYPIFDACVHDLGRGMTLFPLLICVEMHICICDVLYSILS